MKTLFISLIAFSLAFAGTKGSCCPGAKRQSKKSCEKAEVKQSKKMICSACGEIHGSKNCCKKGAKECKKCGLHKGSPGCCKIQKGKSAELCPSCGEIHGSKSCCKEGAKKCNKCGMNKGSPGCCKNS